MLLRAEGRGAPIKGDTGKRGDLLARVRIAVPKKLTRAQRKALEDYTKLDGENPRAALLAEAGAS